MALKDWTKEALSQRRGRRRKARSITAAFLALVTTATSCGSPGTLPNEAGSRVMQLIIMGAPGAGKGTQSEKISENFGIPHISTGEILRAEVAQGTDLGRQVETVMQRGGLVSDEIVLDLVEKRLSRPDCDGGYILDGFPRTLEQAEGLAAILEKRDSGSVRVLNLQVPQEELMNRLLARKRADDTADTIRSRLAVYEQETLPLIAYYRERGVLIQVNGNQTVDKVFEDIVALLR